MFFQLHRSPCDNYSIDSILVGVKSDIGLDSNTDIIDAIPMVRLRRHSLRAGAGEDRFARLAESTRRRTSIESTQAPDGLLIRARHSRAHLWANARVFNAESGIELQRSDGWENRNGHRVLPQQSDQLLPSLFQFKHQ